MIGYAYIKSHMVILQDSKPVSRDSDLSHLLSTYSLEIPSNDQVTNNQDVIKTAMAKKLVTVVKLLVDRQVMLLPSIHDHFTRYVWEIVAAKGFQEPQYLKGITSRWILSDLTANLQHHIAYSCKVRKYGTLVYRPNADLLSLLSKEVWKLRNSNSSQDYSFMDSGTTGSSTDSGTMAMGTLERCFDHLSQLIFTQINTFCATDAQSIFDYDELDLDDLIKQIDPQLWNAVCLLTRSTSELRGTSKVNNPLSPTYHTKSFVCLCYVQFCFAQTIGAPCHCILY